MKIAITGTPGTGKTSVAKELAEILSYAYVDLNKLVEERGLVTGFDWERNSKIVDTEKMKGLVLPDNCVVDGHLSHFLNVDVVVVLRTNPEVLKERLKKKGWNEKKVQENVEAEILGVCAYEAYESGKKVLEVDTSFKTPEKVALEIKTLIEKNESTEEIDWLEEYGNMLKI